VRRLILVVLLILVPGTALAPALVHAGVSASKSVTPVREGKPQVKKCPKGKKCKGMEGLVEEGSELMKEDFEDALLDAALIGAAQRVEHYEIAAYGTVRAFAEELGESEHVSLLEETLEEEKETDEKLTKLAKQINAQANEGSGEAEKRQTSQKKSKRAA